jgi:hypothetical protein
VDSPRLASSPRPRRRRFLTFRMSSIPYLCYPTYVMSKAYRFTLTIPACVRVFAIGPVDSAVSGSSSPSARRC